MVNESISNQKVFEKYIETKKGDFLCVVGKVHISDCVHCFERNQPINKMRQESGQLIFSLNDLPYAISFRRVLFSCYSFS